MPLGIAADEILLGLGFLNVILSQQAHAGFDRGAHRLHGLGLGGSEQPDPPRVPAAPLRGLGDRTHHPFAVSRDVDHEATTSPNPA